MVCGEFRDQAISSSRISQGYIAKSDELTLRVRTRDDKGYLTIKGRSDNEGLSRNEWEWEIPLEDAQGLIGLCERGVIDKTRSW